MDNIFWIISVICVVFIKWDNQAYTFQVSILANDLHIRGKLDGLLFILWYVKIIGNMGEKPDVKKYIENQILGNNKFNSALNAHYAETTARNTSLIERTKNYAVIVSDILDKNAFMLQVTLDNINFELHNDKKDWPKIKMMTEVAKNLTNVHSVLTPKVTVKEVQNKDGTTTRTMWGSNSAIAKPNEE